MGSASSEAMGARRGVDRAFSPSPTRQAANLLGRADSVEQQLRRFHDAGFHFADHHVIEARHARYSPA